MLTKRFSLINDIFNISTDVRKEDILLTEKFVMRFIRRFGGDPVMIIPTGSFLEGYRIYKLTDLSVMIRSDGNEVKVV